MLKRIVTSLIVSLAILAALTITIALKSPVSAAGVNNNPWGYDFNEAGGTVITAPPATFCNYFQCISNFWNGKGYVIRCKDGKFSKSGGRPRGVCSDNGGEGPILYAHASVAQSNPSQPVSSNPPVSSGSSSTIAPNLPYTGSDPYVH